MKIRITESVICNRQHQEVGAIIEATEKDARILIGMGRAVAVVATKPPTEPHDEADEADKGKKKKG